MKATDSILTVVKLASARGSALVVPGHHTGYLLTGTRERCRRLFLYYNKNVSAIPMLSNYEEGDKKTKDDLKTFLEVSYQNYPPKVINIKYG